MSEKTIKEVVSEFREVFGMGVSYKVTRFSDGAVFKSKNWKEPKACKDEVEAKVSPSWYLNKGKK
jgi:hypothetical protein